MLSSTSVISFFQGLQYDFHIVIQNKSFPCNLMFASSISPIIRDFHKSNPTSKTFNLEHHFLSSQILIDMRSINYVLSYFQGHIIKEMTLPIFLLAASFDFTQLISSSLPQIKPLISAENFIEFFTDLLPYPHFFIPCMKFFSNVPQTPTFLQFIKNQYQSPYLLPLLKYLFQLNDQENYISHPSKNELLIDYFTSAPNPDPTLLSFFSFFHMNPDQFCQIANYIENDDKLAKKEKLSYFHVFEYIEIQADHEIELQNKIQELCENKLKLEIHMSKIDDLQSLHLDKQESFDIKLESLSGIISEIKISMFRTLTDFEEKLQKYKFLKNDNLGNLPECQNIMTTIENEINKTKTKTKDSNEIKNLITQTNTLLENLFKSFQKFEKTLYHFDDFQKLSEKMKDSCSGIPLVPVKP